MYRGMTSIIRYCFLVCSVASVSGQLSETCSQRVPSSFNWIPDTWRVILDSYSFEDLLGDTWITSDVDRSGMSFLNFGGVCTRGGTACFGGNNNWVFSHYVQYDSAKEVFFNVSYNFFCSSACSHAYFTLYRYDRNSTSETERTNTLNYQYLTGSETTSQFGDRTIRGSFRVQGVERSSGFSGFYLGIQDTGSCGSFRRILAYYLVCPARVSGLVSFPETTVPASSSSNNVFSGSCAPNSHAVTSLEVQIDSTTGVCTDTAPGGARCECDAGYRLDNFNACKACPEGQYRAFNEDQNSCNNCPSNSEARFTNSPICSCLNGYYRTSQESPATGCTKPPGPVQTLKVVSKSSMSVEISWKRPLDTGRSDYYYSIERSDPGSDTFSSISVTNNLTDSSRTVSYTINNLLPFQTYEIRVITHNGVSNQEDHAVMLRTRVIVVKTRQALPGIPTLITNLCTAVVWKPPERPNGVITEYIVMIENVMKHLPAKKQFFVTTASQQQRNVLAKVRAVTKVGAGNWSTPLPICSDATTACPKAPSCPVCPQCPLPTACPTEIGTAHVSTTEEETVEKSEETIKEIAETEMEETTEELKEETKQETTDKTVEQTTEETGEDIKAEPTAEAYTTVETTEELQEETKQETTDKTVEQTKEETGEDIKAKPTAEAYTTVATTEEAIPSVPGFYFQLNDTKYGNNSAVAIEDIGEGNNSLLCVTEDNPQCCNRVGEFHYPNCSRVPVRRGGHDFWRNRGKENGNKKKSYIRLNRRPNLEVRGEGVYRCEVPYPNNIIHKLYIAIVSRANLESPEGNYAACDGN